MIAYAETNNGFLAEKMISAGFALLVVLSCLPLTVFNAYLVMGYAHIVLAIVYMAKAGKVTPVKTLLYAALVAGMFFVGFQFPREVTLAGAIFLMFHVYGNEMYFIKRPFNLPYLVLTSCLTTVICSWIAARLWQIDLHLPLLWAPVLAAAALGIGLFIYDRGKLEIEMYFLFLVGMLLALLALEVTGHRPFPVQIIGFVIFTHYMTYYVNFTRRFACQENKQKLVVFGLEVLLINLVFVLGYLLVHYVWTGPSLLFKYGYTPVAFYVWSMSHFITTFKLADFKDAFKLGRAAQELEKAYA